MDFLGKVLVAILGRLFADELKAWSPAITDWLTDIAVRRLPQQLQERFVEEWRAHVEEVPGEIGKLLCAFGFFCAGWHVWLRSRIEYLRNVIEQTRYGSLRMVLMGVLTGAGAFPFLFDKHKFRNSTAYDIIAGLIILAGMSSAMYLEYKIFANKSTRDKRSKTPN